MPDKILITLLLKNGLLREGLRHLLAGDGIDVSPAVEDRHDIPDCSDEAAQHVILVDQSFADRTNFCVELRQRHRTAKLVILADHFDYEEVIDAIRQGVDGYLVRDISPEPLVGALRLIALGEKVLPSEMARRIGEIRSAATGTPNLADVDLSEREIEVLRLLVEGSANKVIGRRLGICEATVKVHVKAALRKLRVANRTQAAIWAVQRGLTGLDTYQPIAA